MRNQEHATRSPTEDSTSRTVTIRIDPNTIWRVIAAILITMLALWIVGEASHLLVILAMSFFFSLALQPAVLRLTTKYGWRRGSAVGVIYLIGLIIVVVMLAVLIPALVKLAQTIGLHASEWIANVAQWLEGTFGVTVPELIAGGAWSADLDDAVIDWAQGGGIGNILGIATSSLGLIFDVATIGMFTFYFTADAERLQRTVLSLVRPENQDRVGWTWDQAVIQTGGYFYSRMLLMVINGFGFFVTMVLVGVPVAISLPLALIAGFIAAFIPAIGTYIGSAIPIVVTLGLAGLIPAVIVLVYALVYQQIENYWLSPKISSKTMTLNGAVAFGAALAGGAIAGPLGAFVALPVAALITALISNFVTHYEVGYVFSDDKSRDTEEAEN
ncbi:MAG: AI-2E family transporter [Actinomycetota bacterium]|nr:AI-2E family transporter [Actinomycetota bacterium]MDK1095888.1 AI-2E family transporter [Actinomycetota bacterium]MDK1102110.1 AI-2E family transporter [Actinomycetota bacterium]